MISSITKLYFKLSLIFYFWTKWGAFYADFFAQKTALNFLIWVPAMKFLNRTCYLSLLVTITMTESQILASKLPKLQDQNMTIFQTLYWVLPQWNYHGGTAPGRMEECCNAFYMQFLVFSVLILIVCHTLRQLLVQNSSLFLKIISPSGIAIVNHTGTAPGHVGQCFNALAFCIFSCSYSKKWYF